VRYVVVDPRLYLFEVNDPDSVIRAVTESVLREAVAAQPFLDLLTVNRERFQRETLGRIGARCAVYGRLGIRLDGLSLHDWHTPQEVVPDYHKVTEAMQERDSKVNRAEADALNKKREAEWKAVQTVRQARAAAYETVKQTEAGQFAFLAKQAARGHLNLSEEG